MLPEVACVRACALWARAGSEDARVLCCAAAVAGARAHTRHRGSSRAWTRRHVKQHQRTVRKCFLSVNRRVHSALHLYRNQGRDGGVSVGYLRVRYQEVGSGYITG